MGYVPEVDIPIQIIGKRKGERLEEYLYSKDEQITPTEYPKILKLQSKNAIFPLEDILSKLQPYCTYDESQKDLYRNREKMVNYIKENFLAKE